MELLSWTVDCKHSGESLGNFIFSQLDLNVSKKQIKRSLERNSCQVNGKLERFSSVRVYLGDKISLNPQALQSTSNAFCFEKKRVLYEDDQLLVYDKPACIPVDTADGLLSLLKKYAPTLQLVHRLDKDTTGVMLFAKTDLALQSLSDQFRQRKIRKEYLAVVDGVPKDNCGVIKNTLGPVYRQGNFLMYGQKEKKNGGKDAETAWNLVDKRKRCSLIRCYPKTGRTHQLRVHLCDMGHPILGDDKYGRKHCFLVTKQPKQCMLHAEKITFDHPIKKHTMTLTAPLPDGYDESIDY